MSDIVALQHRIRDNTAVENLQGWRVLFGISGSIAAYKAAELIRALTREGCVVQAAMTPDALRFLGAATVQGLTSRPVLVDMFTGDNSQDGMDHIAHARAADAMLIAPASAQTLARIANGLADEPVSMLACAASCPIVLAPAMNVEMWNSPATRRNADLLRSDGLTVVEPDTGELACGEQGAGRLAEPGRILAALRTALARGKESALAGLEVVVSAGATVEPIDDMRAITNLSTGKMGYAFAAAARDAGARVTLITGRASVSPPAGMAHTEEVSTVEQMRRAVLDLATGTDVFVSVAAVSDYRARKRTKGKPPRTGGALTLDLVPSPDIIAELAAAPRAPMCVAFAAESAKGAAAINAAREKIRRKAVSAIVVSPLSSSLGGDSCDLTYMRADGSLVKLGRLAKPEAASELVRLIGAQLLPQKRLLSISC